MCWRSPCDLLLDVAQPPIAIAASKGLPVFSTPKHSTKSLRIAATTICLGLRRPRDFNRDTSATIAELYRMADKAGMYSAARRTALPILRCVARSMDARLIARFNPVSDRLGARAQYIWTRQFGQHYASQSLTDAADAQQKIAFRLQVAIIVDRQCDGFVDRSELAREVRDRRIGQGLSLPVDNAAVLAILPFRQARDDARSDRLQLTQPTVWPPRVVPTARA